jgi:glycosyltransferase involved in cell wall biosynthesis
MKPRANLVMLGAAPETRGGVAAAVEAYRADGLFKRWPVDYLPTCSAGGLAENAALFWSATRRFGELNGRHRQLVVHAHLAQRAGLWRQSFFVGAALALRRPVILQLHGGGYERFHDGCSTPARAWIHSMLERAACVIAPCESLRSWVRRIARDARVVVIPPPVTLPRAAADMATRPNVVLSLGRLERDKGVFDLLDAAASVRAAVTDLRVVLAGEGERAPVVQYAERLGIRDAVKFVGWVGPAGKRALLAPAAVLALPSYAEGMPTGLLEAMAAGVPPVAASVGGVPEAIVDGTSGFLVPAGDTAALARHIRKLLLDRALAARVGAAARESVRLRYSAERVIPVLEDVYAAVGVAGKVERPATVQMRKVA